MSTDTSRAASADAGIAFTKMHGAGNDFVVIDRRRAPVPLPADLVARIADRHTGVGFDQLLTLEDDAPAGFDARYAIYNADGSTAQQCGNGVRCLAAWLRRADSLTATTIRLIGPAGPIDCVFTADDEVQVQMGIPDFAPAHVPFIADADLLLHDVETRDGRLALAVASMGNPHAVIEVERIADAPVARLGAGLQDHPRFPDRVNVGFVEVIDAHHVNLRVYERGVGETLACGSGACAAAATLIRRGRVRSPVAVALPGGTLTIAWDDPGHALTMTGPYRFVFEGCWPA
jgi:diaminopimelate epimerase